MPAGSELVTRSWERSAALHRVDAATGRAPSVLTSHEIDGRRTPLAQLLHVARPEIDALYQLVRDAGYVVLFCDEGGVAVEHRGEAAVSATNRHWGTWLGAVWAEDAEGTNGIGTAITERRAVTIHRGQHFRTRHKELSCSGAPIFGADGSLLAVLDVSAVDPTLSEPAHALTGALTVRAALAIQERAFRDHHRRQWVIAAAPPESDGQPLLLALDDDQRITGADAAARATLLIDEAMLATGVSLRRVFDYDAAPFRHKGAGDLAIALYAAGGEESWPALLTPPERPGAFAGGAFDVAQRIRPRRDLLRMLVPAEPQSPVRGGLSAGALRRVREHIEAQLADRIDLASLAGIAGVSVFHFVRQFKQSVGQTPHAYIVERRIERARSMLARTDFPLAEIALAAGFADQAHFARLFHRMTGSTPREFRWAAR